MGLRVGDLRNTVLSKVSIDEFEPKTGEPKDVMVIGFYVSEGAVGEDLYHFLNGSVENIRDVEVSPNPNEDNYYLVFVELDRDEHVKEKLHNILDDVSRVSGDLKWKAKTYLNDEYLPINSDELQQYIITNPEDYVTREEFEDKKAAEEAATAEAERELQEAKDNSDTILEFLRPTNLLRAGINDGKLHMQDARSTITLEVVDFGEGPTVMQNYNIAESAIKTDYDRTMFDRLRGMLGEMKALPIDEYIVIYNPADQGSVLLARPV